MKTDSNYKKHLMYPMVIIRIIILVSLIGASTLRPSTTVAQANEAYVRHVRAINTGDIGLIHPAGLSYSPNANTFHIMEARAPGQTPPPFSDLITVTPFENLTGSARIDAAVKDPINMAFDGYAMRLLILQPESNKLIEVSENVDRQLDPTTLIRHDIRQINVQNPQGMTVDPSTGNVYILDGVGPGILRVEPDTNGGFEGALISRIDLSEAGLVGVRGLAFDPISGHLHVLDPTGQALYEFTDFGQLVSTRNLSEFQLINPQGMVFAPSADLTDDPAQMHLYIADSGAVTQQTQGGRLMEGNVVMSAGGDQGGDTGNISELSFDQVPTVVAADFSADLVQTIDASAFSPPSPDTAGITYLEDSDTLLLSDSEVNEMSIFSGDNLFEVSLNGNLQDTLTTISFSDEPTGVTINPANGHLFISDDTGTKRIYELDPGSDGLYDTADDIVTSFATESFGSGDPEGVTFDRWAGVLFIADGVNAEVYRVSPGANGVFDGVPPAGDDQVTHFDTSVHGINDPEGIAFNDDNGNLYVIGQPTDMIAELTTGGDLVQIIDISAANAVTPAGLAYAPSSQNPSSMNIYIAARGIDNNSDPNENDGKVYEMTLPTTASVPPVANDDNFNTIKNNPVTIDVVANDNDQNGDLDPSTVNNSCTGCSDPSNGALFNHGNGIFTYTPDSGFIGEDSFVYQVCDAAPLCDTATVTINVLEQQAVSTVYIGSTGSGNAGGVAFTDEDILAYDNNTGTWSMHFDGSDVGLDASGMDIDAFHIMSDGSILLSLAVSVTLPDAGTIDVFDIVRFIPTSLGEITAGSYELYLDGSDVGLTGEDIDAIGIAPDGRITISTRGSFSIGGVSGADEDMLIFNATSLGEVTSGTWEMYFDGSDVGLSDGGNDEDINATWIDDNGDIYLTTRVAFNVDGAVGDSADILTCVPGSLGVNTSCTFSLFWDGSSNGFAGNNIDGLALDTGAEQTNDPPVANDDSASTNEDILVSINVASNDSDIDDNLDPASTNSSCLTCSNPSHGSLLNNGDGTFTYTPNLNFNGSDTFIYEICDTLGACDTATVSITISPVPDPPLANDDDAMTSEDTPVTIDVVANDSDPDGDLDLSSTKTDCSNCNGPTNGSLENHSNGIFTYSPEPGFSGSDNFIYEICDSLNACDTALVDITVNPTNDPPVAVDDSSTTTEDTAVIINVVANDNDPDGNLLPSSANTTCVNGSAGCVSPTNGNLINNGDGSFVYSPNLNFNGTDNFVYEVCDTLNACDTANVSITIDPVNDPPVANDDSATTPENTAVTINVTANDSDPDGNLNMASANTTCANGSSGCTNPANGTMSNNGDGSFTYTPNPSFNGADNFVYEVCDSTGLCDIATVNITVTPIAPTMIDVRVASASDDAEEKTTGRVTLNSSDLELILEKDLQIVGMRFTGVTIPKEATIVDAYLQFQVDETDTIATILDIHGELNSNAPTFLNATNNISNRVTTTASVAWAPNPWTTIGEAGADQRTPNVASIIQEIVNLGDWADGNALALIISGSGKRVAESFNGDQSGAPLLHVEYTTGPPNIPPSANDDSASTPEDTLVTIDVAANDNDPDGSLNLASANTACAACTNPSNGSLTNNSDGSFDFDPNPDYNGSDSFVYEICDTLGGCDTATVSITISQVPDPPLANDDSATTSEDTSVIIDVVANDNDPDGDLVLNSTNTGCSNCDHPTNGSLDNHSDGTFTYFPNPGFNGSDSFIYEICDSLNACDTALVTITVNPSNDPPVANDDSASTTEDTDLIIDVAGNDSDPDGNLNPATTNTTCANGSTGCTDPTKGTLINISDGSFEYTPDPDFNGSDSFVYEICDTLSACDTAVVSITIEPVNDPPVAIDDSATTSEDTSVTINVTNNDSDIDGNLVPASANTTCANGSSGCAIPVNGVLVNIGDGSFSYTPNSGFTGLDNFTYEVCDSDGLCDVANGTITVETQGGPISNIFLSSTSGGSVGGVSFTDDDILAYDTIAGTWSMYFDGSDVGLTLSGQEIDAFHINPDGSILFSLDIADTLPDVSDVDEFDIIRFIPTSLGENTSGSFELYLDGSDVGLTGEDIDAIGVAPDGRLTISTRGSFSIGGVSGTDDDMLIFTATSLGEVTSGSWEMYFDGSDVGIGDIGNDEDINGTWIDDNGDIYLTTRVSFDVDGTAGDSADIFACTPASTGTNTSCTFSLFWDGGVDGFGGENINGLFLAR